MLSHLIFILYCLAMPGYDQVVSSSNEIIDAYIADQCSLYNCTEVKKVRKILKGDLNDDSIPDFVIQYGMEPKEGNGWSVRLVVFFDIAPYYTVYGDTLVASPLQDSIMTLNSVYDGAIYLEQKCQHGSDCQQGLVELRTDNSVLPKNPKFPPQ